MSKKILELFPTTLFTTNLIDTNQYSADDLSDLGNMLMDPGAPETPDHIIGEGNMKTCYVEDWRLATYMVNEDDDLCSAINAGLSILAYTSGLELVALADSWYTVMHKGSRIHRHRHDSSVLSGTLFVNAPEGSHGIAFVNPTTVNQSMYRVNTRTKYTEAAKLIPAKTGDLFIYPSWLEQFVPVVECDNRITISFNADYPKIHRTS